MNVGTSPVCGGDEGRLLTALDRLLRRAMGISMPAYGRLAQSPLPFASLWFGAYVIAAVAAYLLSENLGSRSDPRFTSLTIWGLIYFTSVLFIARTATLRAVDTVRRDILPHATPGFIASVANDLERRDSAWTRWIAPLLIAALAMILTRWAMGHEKPPIDLRHYGPDRILWTVIAIYFVFTAARGVLAGRFYEPFALRLAEAEERFYVLGSASTPLVRGVARLGQQMLAMWAMIFVAILSILILGADRLGPYGFDSQSPFLWVVVPIAGFASLGYGSLVYLRSESAIRQTLQRFASGHAEALQRRCNAQLDPASDRLPDDPAEVERLSDWRDQILAGARYENRLGTVLSFTLPVVMPLLSLIRALIGGP